MGLPAGEAARYDRQLLIEGWGEEAQQRLNASTVFIAGAGGLGSPVSMYLAVAGIGRIVICDYDEVELSNLNRQLLHDPTRIGANKAVSARQTLTGLNPDIEVVPITERIALDNVARIVGRPAIILDCLDNLEARHVLNAYAFGERIPLVHGSIWGMDGRVTLVSPPDTPCLRCILPEAPPREVFPVVGATAGIIGSLQALEAIKHLTGIGTNVMGHLLVLEGATGSFRRLGLFKDPKCPVCGPR